MRTIQCQSCAKAYDYDTDGMCPYCGAFNSPSSHGCATLKTSPEEERKKPSFRRCECSDRQRPTQQERRQAVRMVVWGILRGEGGTRQKKKLGRLLAALIVFILYMLNLMSR